MKKRLQYATLFTVLFLASSVRAYPLCLKAEPLFIAYRYASFGLSIEDYEMCPWYAEEVRKALEEIKEVYERKHYPFVSVLSYLLGQSLIEQGDCGLGDEYLQYSYDLALKYGTQPGRIIAGQSGTEKRM